MASNLCYITALEEEKGGFNFENYYRNTQILTQKKFQVNQQDQSSVQLNKTLMVPRKTGTTICGIVTDDGIILGADTRATSGPIVSVKNCEKLRQLTDNIFIAGAGVAADLHHIGSSMISRLELLKLNTRRLPRVISAVTMFQQLLFNYQGYLTCAVVLGGVDCTGPHLYKIYPHGSSDKLPFCAMGSGSLNALTMLELSYKDHMKLQEGKELVAAAIRAGVTNDLGSGGNIDIAVIPYDPKSTIQQPNPYIIRGYEKTSDRPFNLPKPVSFIPGTTPVLQTSASASYSLHCELETHDLEVL